MLLFTKRDHTHIFFLPSYSLLSFPKKQHKPSSSPRHTGPHFSDHTPLGFRHLRQSSITPPETYLQQPTSLQNPYASTKPPHCKFPRFCLPLWPPSSLQQPSSSLRFILILTLQQVRSSPNHSVQQHHLFHPSISSNNNVLPHLVIFKFREFFSLVLLCVSF